MHWQFEAGSERDMTPHIGSGWSEKLNLIIFWSSNLTDWSLSFCEADGEIKRPHVLRLVNLGWGQLTYRKSFKDTGSRLKTLILLIWKSNKSTQDSSKPIIQLLHCLNWLPNGENRYIVYSGGPKRKWPCQKGRRGWKIWTPSFSDSLILTEPKEAKKIKKKISKEILRKYIPYRTIYEIPSDRLYLSLSNV